VKKGKKMKFGFSIFRNTVTEILTRDCHSKMQTIQTSTNDIGHGSFLMLFVQLMK